MAYIFLFSCLYIPDLLWLSLRPTVYAWLLLLQSYSYLLCLLFISTIHHFSHCSSFSFITIFDYPIQFQFHSKQSKMAAFSYQLHTPFHNLDSVYNFQSPQMRMPGFLEDPNLTTTSTLFSPFYQAESFDQKIHAKSNLNESSSCIRDQALKVSSTTLSNNEHSLTNKTFTDSSSVTDRLDSGEQVSQNVPAMDNKRKSKEGPSVNSAQSKVSHSYASF